MQAVTCISSYRCSNRSRSATRTRPAKCSSMAGTGPWTRWSPSVGSPGPGLVWIHSSTRNARLFFLRAQVARAPAHASAPVTRPSRWLPCSRRASTVRPPPRRPPLARREPRRAGPPDRWRPERTLPPRAPVHMPWRRRGGRRRARASRRRSAPRPPPRGQGGVRASPVSSPGVPASFSSGHGPVTVTVRCPPVHQACHYAPDGHAQVVRAKLAS